MKFHKALLASLAFALISCSPASTGGDASDSSSSSAGDSSEVTSSESSQDSPKELADINSLGLHLYSQINGSPSKGHTYISEGTTSIITYSTREILAKNGDTSFSYQGLIGGYYREIDIGEVDKATSEAVDEASETQSTAAYETKISSLISNYYSLSAHFGINSVARPFGYYDPDSGTLSGTASVTRWAARENADGYRVYFESYIETDNAEAKVYRNYEITCDIYLDKDLLFTSISTSFKTASDANWNKDTHSINDRSSITTAIHKIEDVSWGEVPAYDDENPLIDFEPYYVSELTDIDITDTIDGWSGENGNPKIDDYYEIPTSASKMNFMPSTAIDYTQIEVTNVSPAGAIEIGNGFGKFLSAGEVSITFGTPCHPSLLTKTYTVTEGGSASVAPVITSFSGDLVKDASSSTGYFASISVTEEKTFIAQTGIDANQTLDMTQISTDYDTDYLSIFSMQGPSANGRVIYFSVSALAEGTTTLSVTCPSEAESSLTTTWTITITIS